MAGVKRRAECDIRILVILGGKPYYWSPLGSDVTSVVDFVGAGLEPVPELALTILDLLSSGF
jgi:hypothetical protein